MAQTSLQQYIPEVNQLSSSSSSIPEVEFPYSEYLDEAIFVSTKKTIRSLLEKTVSKDIFKNEIHDQVFFAESIKKLLALLPVIDWELHEEKPSFFLLRFVCKNHLRIHPEDFVKKLTTQWLIPGKVLKVVNQRSHEFFFKQYEQYVFYFSEICLRLERDQDRVTILNNIKKILSEISKGIHSTTEAYQILSSKGLTSDEKDLSVSDEIMNAFQKRPQEFDQDLISEMQQFLYRCSSEFKQVRSVSHLARLVCSYYLFRKTLVRQMHVRPTKRHVCLKLLKTQLYYPFGKKNVLGLVIGINMLRSREILEQQHVFEAVRNIIPDARIVKGSFLTSSFSQGSIRSIYVEMEKNSNKPFNLDEIKKLRALLPNELKEHIEHLVPMTFMRRNEEEVYRNIITLREQLIYVRDVPQVIISFEEQSHIDLFFTIVLVRILPPNGEAPSIEEAFKQLQEHVTFIPDRKEVVGHIRKRYPKEANVFRLQLSKTKFLRKNRSVDLYKARQYVASLLQKTVGKFRDYNGGLIIKQDERLKDFVATLPGEDPNLMENFFYSLTPIVMQSVITPKYLRNFYTTFKETLSQISSVDESYIYRFKIYNDNVVIMLRCDDRSLHAEISKVVEKIRFSQEYVGCFVNAHGSFCFGYMFFTTNNQFRDHVLQLIQKTIDGWAHRMANQQHLRINLNCRTPTLDPRITRSDNSNVIVKMLYEGLTRMGRDRKPHPAIAEKIEVSDDHKTYTFHLRKCRWSDGSPISAYDFEYSWKKVIERNQSSIYYYTFKVIKNAKAAFEKKCPIDEVGIHAMNDRLLVVELEHPVPFFLELTSHWTYLLINSKVDRMHPGWAYFDGDTYVCNGPFKLKEWKQNREIIIEKNDAYWDAKSVKLEKVTVTMTDNPFTELSMFRNEEIDFTGAASASLPQETILKKKGKGDLVTQPVAGVFSIWLNTRKYPFTNEKFRRALSLALDRESMKKEVLDENELECYSILPRSLTLLPQAVPLQRRREEAKKLFAQALDELGISFDQLPPIFLSYSTAKRKKVCEQVQKQWAEFFGIQVVLEDYDWGTFYNNVVSGKHHAAGMVWYSWFWDPHYILSSLVDKKNPENPSKWEHETYRELLEESNYCLDSKQRSILLKQVEQIVVDKSPVIPLHQCVSRYLKKDYIQGVYTSELMETDFKWAFIERD